MFIMGMPPIMSRIRPIMFIMGISPIIPMPGWLVGGCAGAGAGVALCGG
jgi:hypothetical protein